MKIKIATRFLLTKVNPKMTEKSVEAYILRNFEVNEVYVRKNPMRFPNYCSFIFITNSEEEMDIDEFEQHQWPGEIKCFLPQEKKMIDTSQNSAREKKLNDLMGLHNTPDDYFKNNQTPHEINFQPKLPLKQKI